MRVSGLLAQRLAEALARHHEVVGLEIDILKRTVLAGALELHLTSLEQSLLNLLAANAGRVVSREEILDALWGVDYVAESNIVDRQIRKARSFPENARKHAESGRAESACWSPSSVPVRLTVDNSALATYFP